MSISTNQHTLLTPHGTLAVEEHGAAGLPLLFIHGNSSSRAIFQHQLRGGLAERYRLIAFDLPGHGESSDAPDPDKSYTRTGFADAATQVLEYLGIHEAVAFGWSLGGHIAIDMIPRYPGLRGLLLTGTPPVGRDNMAQAFKASLQGGLPGKQDWTEADVETFVTRLFGQSAPPFLREAARRADGRFRKRVFEASRAGDGVDQRAAVEAASFPIAMINGAEDPVVNLDYIDSLAYRNLWERRCYRLAGLRHVPFWEAPEIFNPYLERFLRDVASGQAALPSS